MFPAPDTQYSEVPAERVVHGVSADARLLKAIQAREITARDNTIFDTVILLKDFVG